MRLLRPCLLLLTGALGCADLLGLAEYDGTTGTFGTTTGTGGAGGATGGGGAGGTGAATSSGGTGGTGAATGTGGTGGAAVECAAGAKEACYEGPPGTDGIGACKAGERACGADGQWGACDGDVPPQFEDCTTLAVDESCDQIAKCTGQLRWARRFGDAAVQQPARVAADRDGNVVVVGHAAGAIDFGGGLLAPAGDRDAFVARLDAVGKHLWSKRFGSADYEEALGVAIDAAGNLIVVGQAVGQLDLGGGPLAAGGNADIFVVKLTAGGSHVWSKRFGAGANEAATAVAVDAAGDVIVGGIYGAELTLGATALPSGPDDANLFVAKLSGEDGEHVWSKGFPAAGAQALPAIVADPNKDVLVLGHGVGGVDFGGGALGVSPTNEVFLARLGGADGAHVWSKLYGGPGNDVANDLGVGSDGSVVIIGHSDGDLDMGSGVVAKKGGFDLCVWKVLANGTTTWAKRQGDDADQYGLGVAVDAANNVTLAMVLSGQINFGGVLSAGPAGQDHVLVKLDPAGAYLWRRQYPNAVGGSMKLATDPLGRVALATAIEGTSNFGGGPLSTTGPGDGDVVIGHVSP